MKQASAAGALDSRKRSEGGRTSSERILFFPSQSSSRACSFSSPWISCASRTEQAGMSTSSAVNDPSAWARRARGETHSDAVPSQLETLQVVRQSRTGQTLDLRDLVLDQVHLLEVCERV